MTMQYGRITGLDKDISRLAQGCMMLSDADEQSIQDSFAILDAAAATGINCFETPKVTGKSLDPIPPESRMPFMYCLILSY